MSKSRSLKEFAEQQVNLTDKEIAELARILKDEYGIEQEAIAVVLNKKTGDDRTTSDRIEFGSDYFSEKLKQDIKECFANGETVDAFLFNEFGIKNIFDYNLPSLINKEANQISFNNFGTDNKIEIEKVTTTKESADLFQKVISFDVKKYIPKF